MSRLELVVQKSFTERVDPRFAPHKAKVQTMSWTRWRLHNGFALAVGDALALCLSILIGLAAAYLHSGSGAMPDAIFYVLPIWWSVALVAKLLPSWGLGSVEELRRTTLLLAAAYVVIGITMLVQDTFEPRERLMLTCALVGSVVLVPFIRTHVKRILAAGNEWGIPTIVYGAGPLAERVIRVLKEETGLGYNPVGVLDDNPQYWNRHVAGVQVLGDTNYVSPFAPVAILAMSDLDQTRQMKLLDGPLTHYRRVLVVSQFMEIPSMWVKPRDLSGTLGFEITCNLANPLTQFAKRLSDVILVYVTSPIWLPLCMLVALAIWLEDRQNPLYMQKRVGHEGREFSTWKFRTMVPNAEEVLRRRLEQDPKLRLIWETSYKLQNDPRVTKVGNILRKFSLDELPQLINILRGEMSLVGPRPLPQYHHEQIVPHIRNLRERVRPGVTGLWQVSGRSDIGTEGMERLDPYYVRNWSPWLDMVVMARTFRAIVHRKGAY